MKKGWYLVLAHTGALSMRITGEVTAAVTDRLNPHNVTRAMVKTFIGS